MEDYKIVDEIYQSIETNGLMPTIKNLFGVGTKIQIPFSETSCNTEIENLNLSVRSYNCLKRAGLNIVSVVIDAMMEGRLSKIRNLGNKSIAEIHVRIYEFGYDSLTEPGRKQFAKTLFELNKDKYHIST